jgi:hypothetical protein
MTPIVGFFALAVMLLVVAIICVAPLLATAATPRCRRHNNAWNFALIPAALFACAIFVVGLSCTRDNIMVDAVEAGDAPRVQSLLENGVPADTTLDGYDVGTVLLTAVDHERWDIVKLLADHGATDTYRGDDDLPEARATYLLDQAHHKTLADQIRRNTARSRSR